MEKRSNVRKKLRLPCNLEFSSGIAGYGMTANLSYEGALVECNGLSLPGRPGPEVGEFALFLLTIRMGGRSETLKINCRVAHITGKSLGLQLMTSGLAKPQMALLVQLLEG